MGYRPKYCPECGSETHGNKICALCDFKLHNLVNVSDTEAVEGLIIIGTVPLIILTIILLIFDICFVCKFAEWIRYWIL
ncbi:MAG: hypothetical protein PQ971_07250 [Methanobacterium sp.]